MSEDQSAPKGGSPEQIPMCNIVNVKSADDILNELFTELGSKDLNESLESFLNPVKKKKKHKEKVKEKIKKKKKEKLKDKEHRKEKKHKKLVDDGGNGDSGRHGSTSVKPHDSSVSPTKKRKGDKSNHEPSISDSQKHSSPSSSQLKKRKLKHEAVDIEEGEIVDRVKDKDRHSKHQKSKKRHSDSNDLERDTYMSDGSYERGRHSHRDRSKDHKYPEVPSSYERSNAEDAYSKSDRDPDRHIGDGNKGFERKSRYHDSDRERDRDYDTDRKNSPSRTSEYRHVDRNNSPSRHRSEGRFDHRQPSYRPNNNRRFDYNHEDSSNGGRKPYRYAPSQYGRSRSRSRSRSRHPSDVIDKPKLLEIARRNATLLMKKGVLPTDIFSRDQIVAIKAGGKSVEELTSYCRRLAKNESHGGDEFDGNNSGNESDGHEPTHFIHHPFVVKDRPMPQITLNIRNAVPLPVRTPQEMAIENAVRKTQFPVSSGCQHRYTEIKELEWKEVQKDTDKDKKVGKNELALVPLSTEKKAVGTVVPTVAKAEATEAVEKLTPEKVDSKDTGISVEPPILPHVDIGSVISARLKAMRTLKENPESQEAKSQLTNALQEMEQWAQAKALEPKFLTASDLGSGPQAWAKRDQLKNAKEVASGMGMHLLQKMGWRPGEGLGKNKEGSTEPLALDVKTDKKGLTSQADLKVKGPQANLNMIYDLSGKHPVSALMELCTKRRWGPPSFDLCFEHGPPHQKSFVFKVTVNGVEYQPCIATNNKKLAKANAAAFCLQSLGLLKATPQPSAPPETLQTVPSSLPPGPTGDTGIKMIPSHLLQTVSHNHP